MGTFNLKDYAGKVVRVMPVVRPNGFITDPEHEAAFLVGPATNNYSAPMGRNGGIICPLTSEEREVLEKVMQKDLSPYKDKDNFWKEYKVRLGKDTRTLRLDNPKEYIEYKLLLANKDRIAPDPKEAKRKRTYKYMIVSEDHEVDSRLNAQAKLQEAYKFFGKIEDNDQEMMNFLKIYGKKVPYDASSKWLKDQIGKIITENLAAFLDIARDENRKTRLLILDAVDAGIVVKDGRKFYLQGGEPLSAPGEVPLMDAAVKFLKLKKNQDILLEIQARLDNAKD
jgi:hypothetical protein